jgi:hypothetical protein
MNVGITGHQHLGSSETEAWVRKTLQQLIKDYRVTHGFTCLAAGADQLYAELLVDQGIPYTPILPCRRYEEAFADTCARERFTRLRSAAPRSGWVDFDRPSPLAFFAAGQEVVDRSDMMCAVWDGKEARGFGGTADVVSYAFMHRIAVIHLDTTRLNVVTFRPRPIVLSLQDVAGSIICRGSALTPKGSGNASNIVVGDFLPK